MKNKLTTVAALAVALASSPALAYTKPPGAPTLTLPDYGLTISVFATATGVGKGIGVFEFRPATNDWGLCGDCIVDPQLDADFEAQVMIAGGGAGYVQRKKGEINALLARRYPAIGAPPMTTLEQVNAAVAAQALQLVNGLPVFAP